MGGWGGEGWVKRSPLSLGDGAALRTDEKNPKGDRGVLFNPQLPDGEFRQYGMLPLRLWAAVPGRSGDEQ